MRNNGTAAKASHARNATRNAPAPDAFTLLCHAQLGIEPTREYRFHPTRKWRFDYAIPALKIAIECDGGIWTHGRHVSPTGFLRDMEKFNAAAELGWAILKFTPDQLVSHDAIATIRATIAGRMAALAPSLRNPE